MERYTLNNKDFRHIVRGGILEFESERGGKIQVAMQDIGIPTMVMTCQDSIGAKSELGEVRKVE